VQLKNDALECLKLLIENGANLNVRSNQRLETPLQIAIGKNNERIYDFLTKLDVDFKLRNKDGENALFYAIWTGSEDVLDDSIK
jgi:ankyrin repeat protein